MSIKLDWEIIEKDEAWSQEWSPAVKPRRRVPRRLILALALIPIVVMAIAATCMVWTYHAQLGQVTVPVQQVARAELQAVAANDQVAFMALQDPDDSAWRTRQERNFGRLQRVGLPEFGWEAMGVTPQIGRVSLVPGGSLVQVTYQFAVTQPMPGGTTTVTVQIPEYFKSTPSGWTHAMLTTDAWGAERTQSGKHILALYHQLDASVVEPLIPHMDDLVARLCAPLSCPAQVSVVFENSVNLRGGFLGGVGFDNSTRSSRDFLGGAGSDNSTRSSRDFLGRGDPTTLRLPSPYLLALPTDVNSRDELYRAFEIQLAQMVVSQALGRNLYMNRAASLEIVQWELTRVGLVGPFITEANRNALAAKLEAGVSQPLATIPLRSSSFRTDATNQAMMSFAFAFLEQTVGAGTIERLVPAMGTSATLGDAIHVALNVDSGTLEAAWQNYLKDIAGRQGQSRQGA